MQLGDDVSQPIHPLRAPVELPATGDADVALGTTDIWKAQLMQAQPFQAHQPLSYRMNQHLAIQADEH